MQTYVTLEYNGVEKSLADWGVAHWRREVNNQASDTFACNLIAATDSAEIFPFGAMVTIRLGRIPAAAPGPNVTLPLSGVIVWSGGTKWFTGWRVQTVRHGSFQLEQLACKFAGPWDFFLERLVFQKLWLTWNGAKQIADWRSQVVLGQSVNSLSGAGDTVAGTTTTNLMSIAQQLKEIAAYAIAQSSFEQSVNGLAWPMGAQFAFDDLTADSNGNYHLLTAPSAHCTIPDYVPGFAGSIGDTSVSTSGKILRAPLDAVNDMTCAEAMRRMLRWIGAVGSPVVWFDYTTTPPTLKVSTRDELPAATLPFTGSTSAVRLQRRDDLIPPAIHFKYRISGQIGGTPYTVIENDIAATIDGSVVEGVGTFGNLLDVGGSAVSSAAQSGLPLQARRFGAQVATIDCEGFSASALKGTIVANAHSAGLHVDPSGNSASQAFWQSLFPDLLQSKNLGFYQDTGTGVRYPTVVDNSGGAISTGDYPYFLEEGQIAPWMYHGAAAGAWVEATITAWFQYDDSPVKAGGSTKVVAGRTGFHPRTVKKKLCNIPSGTYSSATNITQGEPIPYGLAGFVYALESIPQFQGSFTVQESDVTDVCAIGHALNLSGGLSEWATMQACVQNVNYDDTGRTEIIFGPAQHLGNADLVERLRVNRGPRWLNLIGRDLLNADPQSGPLQVGSAVPKHSAADAERVPTFSLHATSVPDLLANPGAYGFPPGVSIYAAGAAPGEFSSIDSGPGIIIAGGSGGATDGGPILISRAQLAGAAGGTKLVKFFELNTCEDGDNTYYRTFLCTDKYHH